jgi:PPP family 3-phenylpropionic acid transporter
MAFDPPLAMLFALQVLHALTYAATHLGAMQFLARAVPPDQSATAQGVYALVTSGLAAMLANHVAGLSYAAAGGRAYFAMALMALIALAALAHLARRWDGSEIATTRS